MLSLTLFWDMYHCLLFSFIRDVCHELLGHVPLFAVFFYKGRLSIANNGTCPRSSWQTSLIKENSKQWYMSQKFMTNVPYKRKQQTMWDMYHFLLFSFIRDVCHELLGHVPFFAIFFYKGCLPWTSGTCTIVCYFLL
jgi:hypothetical protein